MARQTKSLHHGSASEDVPNHRDHRSKKTRKPNYAMTLVRKYKEHEKDRKNMKYKKRLYS